VSREKVEIARRSIEAFNRWSADDFFALATGDFEWFPAMPVTVGGSAYTGRDGIERYMRDIGETWEEYRVAAEEFRELDEGVLVLGRIEGRGRSSRAQVQAPFGILIDFRDGRMRRIRTFLDRGQALAAAGLEA
jgi:ketosteroid isomerase-like protein